MLSFILPAVLDMTNTLSAILSTEINMKYNGCHFDNIAVAMARAPFDRDKQPNAALAETDSAAATMLETMIEYTMLSSQSERNTALKRDCRHAQQMDAKTEAANTQSFNAISPIYPPSSNASEVDGIRNEHLPKGVHEQ